MNQRKTAQFHPRRDGNQLRREKIDTLKNQIESGKYEVGDKFDKIINSFIGEMVK